MNSVVSENPLLPEETRRRNNPEQTAKSAKTPFQIPEIKPQTVKNEKRKNPAKRLSWRKTECTINLDEPPTPKSSSSPQPVSYTIHENGVYNLKGIFFWPALTLIIRELNSVTEKDLQIYGLTEAFLLLQLGANKKGNDFTHIACWFSEQPVQENAG